MYSFSYLEPVCCFMSSSNCCFLTCMCVAGSKLGFRIKPHSHQRCSEGSNKPCVHHDPGTPQILRPNCVWASPVEVQVGGGLLQEQGLWVQQTWVWHKPFGGGNHQPHHRVARTYTGLGNRLLVGTTEPCAPGPGRKKQCPHRDCPGLACGYPGISGGGMGPWWPATGWGTECSSTCMRYFERGHHYLHYLHHSLAPGK